MSDDRPGGPGRRVVFYDAGCGVCTHVMRALARRDRDARLTWIPNQDRAAVPADVPAELLEQTILVIDPATGRRWTRARACYEALAVLPWGRWVAWPLVLPGLRTLAGWFYDWFSRNRADISVRLGLAACVVPRSALDTDRPSP